MIGHGSFYAATPPLPYSFAMNECRIGHRQVGANIPNTAEPEPDIEA